MGRVETSLTPALQSAGLSSCSKPSPDAEEFREMIDKSRIAKGTLSLLKNPKRWKRLEISWGRPYHCGHDHEGCDGTR
jgi:hypothetical protein